MITCPTCGARNPENAGWCSQCYTDLRTPAEPPPATGTETAPRPDATPAAPTPIAPTGTPAGDATADAGGRFRRSGEEFEWRCEVCATWNPVGTTACSVCGTSFGRSVGLEEEEPLRDVDEGTVLIASAFLPGLGHILLGRTGMGVVRALTYVIWLAGGWILLRGAAGTGGTVLPAVPLLLGAFLLWVASGYDAVALAGDRGREVLTPRIFFWLVVGVIGLLILAAVPAIVQAGASRDV